MLFSTVSQYNLSNLGFTRKVMLQSVSELVKITKSIDDENGNYLVIATLSLLRRSAILCVEHRVKGEELGDEVAKGRGVRKL